MWRLAGAWDYGSYGVLGVCWPARPHAVINTKKSALSYLGLHCVPVYIRQNEDGGSITLRNIGAHLPDYTMSLLRMKIKYVGMVNGKLERIQKELVMAFSRYYLHIYLEGLRKTTKNPRRDIWCTNRYSNRAPRDRKFRA